MADAELVRKGCCNLIRHIRNLNSFGVPVVVAVNAFSSDSEEELRIVVEEAKKAGAFDAVISRHHSFGGAGAVDLGNAVMRACSSVREIVNEIIFLLFDRFISLSLFLLYFALFLQSKPEEFRYLYPLDMSLEDKIRHIATSFYGASDVSFSPLAEKKLKEFASQGYGNFPICMAKTPLSMT